MQEFWLQCYQMMTEGPLAQKHDPEFTCYASMTHKLFHLHLEVSEVSKLMKYPEPCAMFCLTQSCGKTLRPCTLLLLLQWTSILLGAQPFVHGTVFSAILSLRTSTWWLCVSKRLYTKPFSFFPLFLDVVVFIRGGGNYFSFNLVGF